MSKNVKQTFETLAVAVLCTVFILSMHQSCSGLTEKFSNKKTEVKKVQELKNNAIKSLKIEQRAR